MMTLNPMLTQADIDAKVQRLFNAVVAGKDSEQRQEEAVAIGMELASLLIGAFLRMADAQERMAAVLEDEFGPSSPKRDLFQGK